MSCTEYSSKSPVISNIIILRFQDPAIRGLLCLCQTIVLEVLCLCHRVILSLKKNMSQMHSFKEYLPVNCNVQTCVHSGDAAVNKTIAVFITLIIYSRNKKEEPNKVEI